MGDRISGWNNYYDFKIFSVAPWNSSVHFESLKGEISLIESIKKLEIS